MTLPKLYPDRPTRRLLYLLADGGAALWVLVWLLIGYVVYRAVMTLGVIADGVIATGRLMSASIAQLQHTVAGLPLVGSTLRDGLGPLYQLALGLIAQGQHQLEIIQHLALFCGGVIAATPILFFLAVYLFVRARLSRRFRALHRMLTAPGASASPATTMQVLAGRAIYALPYHELLRYTPDPIGEWRQGHYANLARAAIAAEGLDARRYQHCFEGAIPEPPRLGVPTVQADER